MSDPMHGIEADVDFDFDAADTLVTSCNGAADTIEGQVGSRASHVTTALKDFRGHFSELFSTNATTAKNDATELVGALRMTARYVTRLKEEARKEQQRRETARKWKKEQDDRSMWDKGVDAVFGGDDPPVGPAADPITQEVPPPPARARQTPNPGGNGGGSATSSARPSDLHSFATASAQLNTALEPKKTKTEGDYHHFVATCHWGSLSAGGVFTGFTRWLSLNDDDVTWAKTVGDAFAKAGSEGAVTTLSDAALAASLKSAGVSASRQDLTIGLPSAYGHPPTTGYADDPVNTATGSFVETECDLSFAGGNADLRFTRTYNSVDPGEHAFGRGWSSWTEAGLVVDDEAAHFTYPDGRVVVFPRLADGWDRATGENLWLTRRAGGYVVAANDGSTWEVGADGRLAATASGPGTRVSLTWTDDRLVALRHERGRSVELRWANGRVVGAVASDGREVTYAYDDEDRLVGVSSALGTRRYGWGEDGRVATVTSADGVVEVDNDYDAGGRVTAQRSPFGRTSRYVYLPGRVTVVSDLDGTRSNTWIADPRGRLVGVVDAHDQRQSTSSDGHGNPVLVRERDGSVTVQEYDGRGRLVRRVTPSGADLEWSYDEADRVVEVVSEEGATTTLRYDGDERGPSTLVDPEGGQTRLTWRDGLLVAMVDPTGVELTFAHDEHGDLVAMTAADGGSVRYERDGAGRVSAVVSALGARTELGYDERGLLAVRRQPDGGEWRFEHTAAGLVSAVVDPLGGREEIVHTHGEPTRTVDALGRVTDWRYDDLGLLCEVALPDGSRWGFEHDALSRLTGVVDPDGGRSTRAYDEVGQLVSETDPSGVATHLGVDRAAGRLRASEAGASTALQLDPLGRLVGVEGFDGSRSVAAYDRCGRLVEQVDAAGGTTRYRRDAAGRVVEVTWPGGGTRTLRYDRCGRLSAVVDEIGASTTLGRDLEGRVVSMVLPDGSATQTAYDLMGRVVRHRVPGVGTATYAYDRLGRVVATTDPQRGRRRFGYDAGGRLVEAVDANGGRTTYAYDAADRLVGSTDPLGGETTRTYDAAGRLVAQTDALGRTTRAGYDAAGRQVWQQDPTGTTVEWGFDDSGRLSSVAVDGEVRRRLERDLVHRSLRLLEDLDGRTVVHEATWDPRGLLVGRTRDGVGPHWRYDADGALAAVTTPDGRTTTYARDAAGRLVGVEHPLLGAVALELDVAGRVVEARAGGATYRWVRRDGFVVGYAADDACTRIDRDADGRVVGVTDGTGATRYGYDAAGQLTSARRGAEECTWTWDPNGRLVAETSGDGRVERTYDAAGQLLATRSGEGTTTYRYDGAGRRTGSDGPGGRTAYGWDAFGWLRSVTTQAAETTLHVDAFGELARVGSTPVVADSADAWGGLLQVGDVDVTGAGPLHGVGREWATGWRTTRPAGPGTRVWELDPVASVGGIALGGAGELGLAGLEWMGARAYDPATRGFLSADPLDPVAGSGWAGNAYSYAGNDPLGALDPLGLSPVTDAELEAYKKAHQGWVSDAAGWVADNWEYVAAAGMIVAGGVMLATGFGGPVGMGLISAGVDTGIQKFTTGKVDWGEVAVTGAVGMVGGGVAGAFKGATQAGTAALRTTIMVNAGVGAGSSEATYLATTKPSDWSWQGAAGSAAGGALGGAVGGAAGPTGGTIAKQLGQSSTGVVARVATGTLNYAGGFAGSAANDWVNGRPTNYTNALISGGASTAGGVIGDHAYPSTGTGTLKQMGVGGVRTWSGVTNLGAHNTRALVGSSITGAAVGGAADVGRAALGIGG